MIMEQNETNVRLAAGVTDSGSDRSNKVDNADKLAGHSTSFYQKLVSLNEKIGVFKSQFYTKKPRQQMSYDNVLKDKKMDFQTFKNLYGHNDEGPRSIKYGNELVVVDNKKYTVSSASVA